MHSSLLQFVWSLALFEAGSKGLKPSGPCGKAYCSTLGLVWAPEGGVHFDSVGFCSPLRTWQWSTKWVSGQPGLRSEAASQKVKTEQEPERQAWGSELSSQNPSMVLSAVIPMPERHDAPWLASQSSFLNLFYASEKHRSTKPGERCLRSHTWGWPLATYGCTHRQPGRMACMYVPVHVCKKLPDQLRTPLFFLWARTSPQSGSVLLRLRSWPLLMAWQVWYFINKGLNVNSVVMWEISSCSQDYNYMASIPVQSLCLGNLEFSVVGTGHLPRALT